jgi:DNA-binding GntR family transcriptional regulator
MAFMPSGPSGPTGEEADLVLDRLQLRYRRVQESLAEEIKGRAPGTPLPPERALAEHFGVSRVTLRHALAELERAGIVARAPSRGWFVAGSRIGEPPNALMSFSEMAASRGLSAGARLLGSRVRPATIDEAETLGLAPGADLFELERLRSMDDVPILIASARLPVALAPGLENVDFSTTSLYDVLEGRYGLRPARAHFTIEAIAAGDRESELLSLEPGQPLLRCHQLTEDETGRMIEICEMRYRGDRYRFRATLVRTGSVEQEGAEALAPNLAGSTTDG